MLTAVVGGGVIAMQAPINSRLGKHVGTFQAAFVSFAVGTLALLVIAALSKGGLGSLRHVGERAAGTTSPAACSASPTSRPCSSRSARWAPAA